MAVNVDSVETVLRRRFPSDVAQECLIRTRPVRTNSDASSPIKPPAG